MTKPSETGAEVPRRRKPTVWTQEKISQLIELYKRHDCLWNHYTEAYKNKERRARAIEDICSSLNITKLDFGKKIHNLRNQFNSEMKKLERRVEETGGAPDLCVESGGCRWKHFEALRFLRVVIEPRPGRYQPGALIEAKNKLAETGFILDHDNEEGAEQPDQQTNRENSTQQSVNREEVTEYHFEETTIVDDDDAGTKFDESVPTSLQYVPAEEREEVYDQKYKPPPPSIASTEQALTITTLSSLQPLSRAKCQLKKDRGEKSFNSNQGMQKQLSMTEALGQEDERSPTTTTSIFPTHSKRPAEKTIPDAHTRDQWDAFGELIASEFRHLNSEISRKKLKRKIMQAMLEVGVEDDEDVAAQGGHFRH